MSGDSGTVVVLKKDRTNCPNNRVSNTEIVRHTLATKLMIAGWDERGGQQEMGGGGVLIGFWEYWLREVDIGGVIGTERNIISVKFNYEWPYNSQCFRYN